jgi:hypothetical protein
MRDDPWEVLPYVSIALALLLIALGALVALGPQIGGGLASLHQALRDAIAGEELPVSDPMRPAQIVRSTLATPPAAPQVGGARVGEAPTVTLSPLPVPITNTTCTALQFEASLSIVDGYVSFGRFNVVSHAEPYGERDPVTQWKLLQFGGFAITGEMEVTPDAVVFPVGQTVNLLLSDPYSKEMLFSAKWKVESIEVHGQRASINAALVPNLSEIGVNNAVDSPTLARLSQDDRGVLVMGLTHTADVATTLRAGSPLYAPVEGAIYPASCAR